MGKFLCSGVIEFPADKMDIVASVLQKHGLEDPNFKEECRTKGEKATYFLEESYGMLFDKDTFKKAFLELLDQGFRSKRHWGRIWTQHKEWKNL